MKDSKLHYGHRDRMRERFITHGAEVFATYELLEMLLYNVISYKDTNDTAKLLIKTFGTLENMFSATDEEILAIRGVGKRTLDLIRSLAVLTPVREGDKAEREESEIPNAVPDTRFTDYTKAGLIAVRLFEDCSSQYATFVIVLDNKMNVIGTKKLFDTDLASSRVRSEAFIDEAIRLGGASVMIAHNHPYGPAFPTPGDIATLNMLLFDLEKAGITLVENFIVCGNKFVGTLDIRSVEFSADSPIRDFLLTREEYYARNS